MGGPYSQTNYGVVEGPVETHELDSLIERGKGRKMKGLVWGELKGLGD